MKNIKKILTALYVIGSGIMSFNLVYTKIKAKKIGITLSEGVSGWYKTKGIDLDTRDFPTWLFVLTCILSVIFWPITLPAGLILYFRERKSK